LKRCNNIGVKNAANITITRDVTDACCSINPPPFSLN
jgi:hypothetical protein